MDTLFIRLLDNKVFQWVVGIAGFVLVWSGLMLAGWFTVRRIWRKAQSGHFGAALVTTLALCSTGFLLWAGSQIAP